MMVRDLHVGTAVARPLAPGRLLVGPVRYSPRVPAPPFQQQQLLAQAQRLHAAGEIAAALPIFQQLHRKDPKNPRLLYFLGAAEFGMGQTQEARAHLTAALRLAPTDIAAWHDLALVHKREGRFAEAHGAIDRAIALKP